MTMSQDSCDTLLPYFLKELSAKEAEAFEAHLAHCADCREQLQELRQVWQALPYEMEEAELPDELKTQMFSRIQEELALEAEEEQPIPLPHQSVNAPQRLSWYRKPLLTAAAVLAAVIGAAVWMNAKPVSGPASAVVEPPASAKAQFVLKAYDPSMPSAGGTAWIEQKGGTEQLVLKMNGLQDVTGEQAYQLWVIKDGKRYNGGTFRTDTGGNAVLTCDLQPVQGTFEALGITLEPDAQGVQPRGKKVLGT